eukprot:EG_transcript_33432
MSQSCSWPEGGILKYKDWVKVSIHIGGSKSLPIMIGMMLGCNLPPGSHICWERGLNNASPRMENDWEGCERGNYKRRTAKKIALRSQADQPPENLCIGGTLSPMSHLQ